MKQSITFSLKVWFTALILTPLLAYLLFYLGNSVIFIFNSDKLATDTGLIYQTDKFQIFNIGWMLLRYTPYYLPYLIITVIGLEYKSRKTISLKIIRFWLTIFCILLILYPFTIFQLKTINFLFNMNLAWISSFGINFTGGVWFYKPTGLVEKYRFYRRNIS